MGRKKLSQTGVPITLYKQGLEQHIGRAISEKEFNILYSGWAYRYAVVTDHNVRAHTPMDWKRKGYIPREAADDLSNYLITGWKITGEGGRVTGYGGKMKAEGYGKIH